MTVAPRPTSGHPQFGFSLAPEAGRLAELLSIAEDADRRGLDLCGIQDHPYQARFADTWTVLAAVGARTSRLRVFADVACLPLRPPAVLAQSVATLDLLTAGRAELGLGTGAFWPAIVAMGGPMRTPAESVDALEEALDIMALMWSGERSVHYEGRHYRLAGVHPGPRPEREIGTWLGALGPRMLRLVGRRASGWIPSSSYVPPDRLPGLQAAIDDAAAAAGREPGDIRRIYNVMGSIGPAGRDWFSGSVTNWVEQLVTLHRQYRMTDFVFWPDRDHADQVARFADEVAPAVREQLGTAGHPAGTIPGHTTP